MKAKAQMLAFALLLAGATEAVVAALILVGLILEGH